jgi:tetratricopeptide (TPR) repeat protein
VLDLLMTTTQDPAATASAKGDKAGAPTDTTLAGGLANLLADPKATAKPEEKWSPPPPNVSSAELVERGHQLYRANRLHDALVAYHQGLMVDSTCEICKRRIDRLNTEIEQAIRQQLDAGLRYYNSLQYEQAITAWETVLLLSPNPESQPHKQAREYMEKAQASLKRQY